LSVHEVGYQIADQSSVMICARLCDMYDSNLHSQWTCTVLWHCKVNPCGVWHQCSLFLKYKHCGVSHYPSQSVSLTAHSHLSGLMVKPFLHSQHKMVANSLTWWFQSMEKAPTSLHIWSHNIIWIHVIWILIMWIHVIGIHIYHMNSSSIIWQFPLLLEQCLESIWVPLGVSSTCVYQMVWWWYGILNFCCQAQMNSIAY